MRSSPFRVVAMVGAALLPVAPAAHGQSMELAGGLWFDGERFRARTMYVRDGLFVENRPPGDVARIDLTGRYVIPPFGDGHAHNLSSEWEWQRVHDAYVREGTFYVLVMSNARSGADQMRDRLKGAATVDVVYGEGAVTSTLGYPFLHYEPRAMGLHDPSTWRERLPEIRVSRLLENDGYWFVNSVRELDAKLPALLANRRSHVKIMLFDAERFAVQSADTQSVGHRGLNPALAADVVSRAHAAGLRVAAHIETTFDFEVAVRAGVDIVAHIPGYNLDRESPLDRYALTPALAALAASRGIVVTPTVFFGGDAASADSVWTRRRDDLLRGNLRLLKEHGVPVAIGTDVYPRTAAPEFDAIGRTGVFSNLELLRMWTETTPRLVFPGRRIGTLTPGFEASFLALECDPLADMACVRRITHRVKQGERLNPDPSGA